MKQDGLGFLIADVARLMRRAFRQRMEGSGLTLTQARVLVYVFRNEGVHQVDLAELLEVQPITLARFIDQLADAGLVERRSDPADRRAYRVFLTPAATPRLAAIQKVASAVQLDALRSLNDRQATAVLVALRRMRDNLASH